MSREKLSNRAKERIGTGTVAAVVEEDWECGWQEYGAQNDDGIDGVILMRRGRKRPTDTGGVIFVQIKCGAAGGYRQDQAQNPNHIGIALGAKYIQLHRPRWMKMPGPAVLIFVDDTIKRGQNRAWWTDLKQESSYSRTNMGLLLVPKNQIFAHHSKSEFHRLCGPSVADRNFERIELARSDLLIPKLGKSESLRNDAWDFYKHWRSDENACTNPALGRVLINRIGWKHITRPGRQHERILQSWLLLGAAKRMVQTCNRIYPLGHATNKVFDDGNTLITDYLGLRASITFPHRHAGTVQVVLRRSRLLKERSLECVSQKIWFYSVYEPRRKFGLV